MDATRTDTIDAVALVKRLDAGAIRRPLDELDARRLPCACSYCSLQQISLLRAVVHQRPNWSGGGP